MTTEEQWFFLADQEQQGPYALNQLQQMADSGALTPETLVWRDGMAEWVPAGSLENFLQWPQAAAPVQPVAVSPVLQTGPAMVTGAAAASPAPIGVGPAASMAQPSTVPRTSTMALISLILGILSIPLMFICLGWFTAPVALILSIVALTRIPGPMGNVKGKGLAKGGLVTSLLAMVIYGIFVFFVVKNAEPLGASAKALDKAENLIMSGSNGSAHGNTPQAKTMAGQYSALIEEMQKEFFVREGDAPKIQISGGKFLTFCQLNEGSVVYLVHVPELRSYEGDAEDSMVELAWAVANQVSQAGGSPLQPGDKMLVGVRGTFLYADIVEGVVGGEDPTRLNLDDDELKLYFETDEVEAAP